MRRYVPELKNYSDKYIYEPWKAPIADQKKWGCIIKGDGGYAESNAANGKNGDGEKEADEDRLTSLKIAQEGEIVEGEGEMMVYPKPMFDFARQRDICINGLKSAYHIGLHGNSPRVLDGTWRELFDDDAEGPTEGKNGPPGAMVDDGHGDEEGEPTALPAAKHKRQRDETPENDVAPPSKSPRTRGSVTPGRRVKAGQATLDGHVKKMKP